MDRGGVSVTIGRVRRPHLVGDLCRVILGIMLLSVLSLGLSAQSALAAPGPPTFQGNGAPGDIVENGSTQTCAGPFKATIDPHELETSWSFDYDLSKQVVAEGKGEPLPEGNGQISTGAGGNTFVDVQTGQLCGLTPETHYYVGLIAKNAAGEARTMREFETVPRRPRVSHVRLTNVTQTAALLAGAVIPDNYETKWHFEYETNQKVLEEGHGTIGPGGVILQLEADEEFHQVSGEVSGLTSGATYYVRLTAENVHGEATPSPTLQFETDGSPRVVTAETHGIHGENIRAIGEVSSDGLDTRYHAEYVDQEQFARAGFAEASPTVEVDIGEGSSHAESANGHEIFVFDSVVVGVDLPGLRPGVVYHYRIVAVNSATTKPVSGNEVVVAVPVPVPVSGAGEVTLCPNEGLRFGASAGLPDCRGYEQVTPADKEGAQDVFNYSPQSLDPTTVGESGEHVLMHAPGVQWGPDPDASVANYFFTRTGNQWEMKSATPQPQAGINSYSPTVLTPDLTNVGLEVQWGTVAHYTQSEQVEFEVGSPGGPYTTVATVPRSDREAANGEGWVAVAADDSKFVLEVKDHNLTGPTGTLDGADLYEWSAGHLSQANVGVGTCGAQIAAARKQAVSADGSRVLFEAVPGNDCGAPENLYARIDGGSTQASTVDIGEYHLLSADPTDSTLLLEKQNNGEYEFFLYDLQTRDVRRILVTREPTEFHVAQELTVAYFAVHERLTTTAPVSFSVAGGPGSGYLYKLDLSSGTLRFLVETSGEAGEGAPAVTANGEDYYWSSTDVGGVPGGQNLPGGILPTSQAYVENGGPTLQRYRYDGAENSVECISCASPSDPEPNAFIDGISGQSSISEDGRYAIFATTAELLPQDIDGKHPLSLEPGGLGIRDPEADFELSVSSDIYEWRESGVSGCSRIQGCLALISSGTGGLRSTPLGITPSGHDIFFATHSQLVPQDNDLAGDIYDARIDGGYPPPVPPPVECGGDACQSPVAAPIDTTPASLSFAGPPSMVIAPAKPSVKVKSRVKACAKGRVRDKRGVCVKSRKVAKRTGKTTKRSVRSLRGDRK